MTRKEMTNERAQSDVRINSAEQGGIGRSQIESLFKTHYTQMYHLALTLLFDEAESKDVVSDVFASLLSGKAAIKREQSDAGISSAEREQARPKVKEVMRADNAKAFLLASVRHRCMNVLQHKQVKESFAHLLTEDTDTFVSDNTVEEQMQMEELMSYVRDNLSPMEQDVFRLRYLREMTCQEVAEALNVSRQTVHTHLKQSVEKIRKYFNSNSKAI
ncbi:MAG: sigma-70 family RNA polymerase sigma factor [Bacteroidaceae bacterium]|nr:sigma-70 family RNA polymerase sigma factor [Bacteroidaceae bacterium]